MPLSLATVITAILLAAAIPGGARTSQQVGTPLPSTPLAFGDFLAHFDSDQTFTLEGAGWPTFIGTWSTEGARLQLHSTQGGPGCEDPGRYGFQIEGTRLHLELDSDTCNPRRMILDGSNWRPAGEDEIVAGRSVVHTSTDRPLELPVPGDAAGSWPSFRGTQAEGSSEGQHLPDEWDGETGENILWRTPIPGLGHSSPIVWGDRIFVTSAISSDPNATFRPGLYGDGDASTDRSRHRWGLYAIDKTTGKVLWNQVAYEGTPVDKRHVKSTYASSTPVTDGRIVVASFGSHGIHAYDVTGNFLWKVDMGRVDVGAYDIPTFEWGPASSPIIWNGLVIVQSDTQGESFMLALDAETGETVWQTERDELPSWGTPNVAMTSTGPELVTNASNFIRGYDPRTGKELWKLGGSSKITAPTPVFSGDLFVVASGRAPERPIFVIRSGSRGDLTLSGRDTTSEAIAWSRTLRGSYMPTPLIYDGLLYVLGNNGIFDAYHLATGQEIYRQRLEHLGSGFSASPVAADGKIYLSGEDGEMLVITAGPKLRHIATNSMGELLMATPALSDGVMYVRSSQSLFAVGQQP
jgi:outer membrane protein assembly factor BamB